MSNNIHDKEVDTATEQEAQEPAQLNLFALITGIIMVVIYMGMAFLLVFTTLFVGKVPEWVRYMMGVVFFLYGLFRGYRVYTNRR